MPPLPRLRMDLDFMASPLPDHPGLLMRDPHRYSDATIIVPPPLVPVLELFDGTATELDVRRLLVEITGQFEVGETCRQLHEALSQAGFLHDEVYEGMREARRREFAAAPVREAAHAGTAYPDDPEELRRKFDSYFDGASVEAADGLCGIAAPHVSPDGGWESYRDAYRALSPSLAGRVFIVLGTSHFGAPDRFGLTRKNYRTPLGDARTETEWVDWLASQAPGAVEMDDYCHATEHSIEFQVAFLQYVYGPDVRVLPVLAGSYARSILEGGRPEDNEDVRRFLGALGELNARHTSELFWVLGVDMAHIGRRYGDPVPAVAYHNQMIEVSERDKERIGRVVAGDAEGFWQRVQDRQDDLRWCGSSPFYTFLRAVPQARGELVRYQHWQIDPHSVVSFAAMTFRS